MNLKKLIGGIAKDKLAEQAARRILPLEETAPAKGWKLKVAGALTAIAAIAAIAGTLSQFLGGQ
jgi:hypothetical protein